MRLVRIFVSSKGTTKAIKITNDATCEECYTKLLMKLGTETYGSVSDDVMARVRVEYQNQWLYIQNDDGSFTLLMPNDPAVCSTLSLSLSLSLSLVSRFTNDESFV